MTKEDILKNKYEHFHSVQQYERSVLCNTYEDVCKLAMDQYAEQQSIGFSEWIVKNKWSYQKGQNIWLKVTNELWVPGESKTTIELYKLFIQDDNNQ